MSIQLNEEQLDAVKFRGKHLLVLAGAGTGKTQTIISRANYLIEHGVSPSRILILSFTRKSAQEIVERIKAVSFKKSGISNLVGRTFHSWCMDIIKNNPDIFQHHNYSVIDREDQEGAFRFLCGKNYKDSDNKRISPVKLIDVYSYSINTKCSLTESIRVKAYDSEGFRAEQAALQAQVKDLLAREDPARSITFHEDIFRMQQDKLRLDTEIQFLEVRLRRLASTW